MEIIDRKTATAMGLKRYFTGKTCRNGHVAERNLLAYNCVMCDYNSHVRYVRKDVEGFKLRKRAYKIAEQKKISTMREVFKQLGITLPETTNVAR